MPAQVGGSSLWAQLGVVAGVPARLIVSDDNEKLASSVGLRKLQQQNRP